MFVVCKFYNDRSGTCRLNIGNPCIGDEYKPYECEEFLEYQYQEDKEEEEEEE